MLCVRARARDNRKILSIAGTVIIAKILTSNAGEPQVPLMVKGITMLDNVCSSDEEVRDMTDPLHEEPEHSLNGPLAGSVRDSFISSVLSISNPSSVVLTRTQHLSHHPTTATTITTTTTPGPPPLTSSQRSWWRRAARTLSRSYKACTGGCR